MSSEIWNLHTPTGMDDEDWYLPRGRLFIGGGGHGDGFGTGVLNAIPTPEAPVVYVPSADANSRANPWGGDRRLLEVGFKNVYTLHTWDRKEADSAEFVKPMQDAAAVILGGGETYRLTETFVGTRFQEELHGVLNRGGIVAGASAGAMVMGSIVIEQPYMRFKGYTEGFGLLRNSIIDVHVLARNLHYNLVDAQREYPDALAIGIDERTVIAVDGNWFSVHGESYVVMIDAEPQSTQQECFYFLKDGDGYDLKGRFPMRKQRATEPFAQCRRREPVE